MSYQAFNDFFIKQDASKLTDEQKKLHDLAGVFLKDKLENSSKELIDTEQSKQLDRSIDTLIATHKSEKRRQGEINSNVASAYFGLIITFIVCWMGMVAAKTAMVAAFFVAGMAVCGLITVAIAAYYEYNSMKSQDVQKQTEQVKSQDVQKQTLEVLEDFNIRTKWTEAVTGEAIVTRIIQNIEKARQAITKTEATTTKDLNKFTMDVIEFAQANDGMTGELYSFENAAKFSKAYQDAAKASNIFTGREKEDNLRTDKEITDIGARLKRIPESFNEEISTKLTESYRSV
jgi:Flp pilus assembly protein TadB